MKRNILICKSAISKVLAVAIIAIVVIVVVGGAYYYSTTMNPSTSPSPSASSTPSSSVTNTPASSASPTLAPSGSPLPSTPIANFRAGAYANYTITSYDNVTGAQTSSFPYNWAVSDGTVNGTSVWVLTLSLTTTSDNVTVDSLTIMNIDKTTHKAISGEIKVISGGITMIDHSIDVTSPQYNTTASAVNPNFIVGKESVTVHAGTFNCDKATYTDTTTGAVSSVWINSSIPVWGIVKMTTTEGTVVTSLTQLVAYG